MVKYTFSGSVQPSQAMVTLPPLWNEWHGDNALRIDVNVTESKLQVDVEAAAAPADAADFYNDIRELAQAMVDAYTFSSASDVVLALERAQLPDGQVLILVPVFPGIRATTDLGPITSDELNLSNRLISLVWRSPALRLALADARRAINSGRDTTFHAYRAVESIRQHFVHPDDTDKKQSWRRMWAALGADRGLVDSFEASATDRRHGGNRDYTHEERKASLLAARQVIQLFADYIEREAAGAS